MRYAQLLIALVAMCGIACTDFIEEPITDEQIELLSPGQHAESATYDINFMWNRLPDADRYHLQIASPGFERTNLFYADTVMEGTQFKISLEPGEYCWRVKGLNGSTETAFSSRCFTIYESDFTKQVVLLNSPANQFLSRENYVTFEWQAVFRASHYVLQVDTNNFQDAEKLVFNSAVNGYSYTLSALKEKTYQWRVKAIYGEQESIWSEIRHFRFEPLPPETPEDDEEDE